jgi:glutamyl-tRNA synthetase
MPDLPNMPGYRGRLAPSPTGFLHLGHARTFWMAMERARAAAGVLVLRVEDLDAPRCRPEFASALIEDLRWIGLEWAEGPDCGGPHAPYRQSQRIPAYLAAMRQLLEGGFLFPCACSRQDVLRSVSAPHPGEDEPVYPGTCRPAGPMSASLLDQWKRLPPFGAVAPRAMRINWRFRVPDAETISFVDGHFGHRQFVAGRDFGDFVVWRHDGIPSYQLAVVVDDIQMRITEVVRGADLLRSTARQILLHRALGQEPPSFHHCPLVTDDQGRRLAKRHASLSLRHLRESGRTPGDIIRDDWRFIDASLRGGAGFQAR